MGQRVAWSDKNRSVQTAAAGSWPDASVRHRPLPRSMDFNQRMNGVVLRWPLLTSPLPPRPRAGGSEGNGLLTPCPFVRRPHCLAATASAFQFTTQNPPSLRPIRSTSIRPTTKATRGIRIHPPSNGKRIARVADKNKTRSGPPLQLLALHTLYLLSLIRDISSEEITMNCSWITSEKLTFSIYDYPWLRNAPISSLSLPPPDSCFVLHLIPVESFTGFHWVFFQRTGSWNENFRFKFIPGRRLASIFVCVGSVCCRGWWGIRMRHR